jgi:hypothetical protein
VHTYIRQSGRKIKPRFDEHIRYITYKNPKPTYARHILSNKHEFGPRHETLHLVRACNKGKSMTCSESDFLQYYRQQGLETDGQTVNEPNSLYSLLIDKHLLPPTPPSFPPDNHLDTRIPPSLKHGPFSASYTSTVGWPQLLTFTITIPSYVLRSN